MTIAERIAELKAEQKRVVAPAQSIKAKAEAAGRGMSDSELETCTKALAEYHRIGEGIKALEGEVSLRDNLKAFTGSVDLSVGGSGQDLAAAVKAENFDRHSKTQVEVPFKSILHTNGIGIGTKAVTLTGDVSHLSSHRATAAALGLESNYLFPELNLEGVGSGETGILTFRQTSRTLPDPATMIRGITATTAKPETQTDAEVVSEALNQIPTVVTGVPNVFLENNGRGTYKDFISTDLGHAYARAVDWHVLDEIAATTPDAGAAGENILEATIHAARAVSANGYSPDILAASPEDLIDLTLLRQPGTDDYVGGQMDSALNGLKRVAVRGLTTPMVLSSRAIGTLYMSPVRFSVHEENNGTTNTSTCRLEANGLFVVQRPGAVASLTITPPVA